MPTLKGSQQNTSSLCQLSIEFQETREEQNSTWQYYKLKLQFQDKELVFQSRNQQTLTYTGTISEIGKFAFALSPIDELKIFQKELISFINSPRKAYRFEPADPSFGLEIERITNSQDEFKIQLWIDAGNSTQLEYTWDALGIRFVSNKINLEEFADSLTQKVLQI